MITDGLEGIGWLHEAALQTVSMMNLIDLVTACREAWRRLGRDNHRGLIRR